MAIHRGNAIPVVAINDTIREVYGSDNKIIDRNSLRAVQTPQGFNSSLIKTAYQQNYNPAFSDDASVLETLGHKINIVEGNVENIKISNSIDLVIADSIINSTAK
jgi:2-C-methyl-D-erythritol 4-phosphate cytidylyltransferase